MTSIIEQAAALTVGTVEFVAPDEIKVLLELDAPQATALNTGRPSRFPRIHGFVLIPNETGAVVGLVSWLGVERSAFPKRTGLRDFGLLDLPFPLRKMSINPVGTLRSRTDEEGALVFTLERGVAVFPSVGDPVLLPTVEQLHAIVEAEGANLRIKIGTSPLSANAVVSVDPDKLFGRHLAVLGNTGSGKSCSVTGLIRWSLEAADAERKKLGRDPGPNARFIVLDPNGEYRTAFTDLGKAVRVFQAPPPADECSPLTVPAWIWNSHEWSAFAQAAPGTQRPLLLQGLRNLRSGVAAGVDPAARLARLLSGYRSLLDERLARGPRGYNGFPANKDTGGLVRHVAADASRYLDEIQDGRDELQHLVEAATELADQRAWSSGTGFNDFAEGDLHDIRDALSAVLARLPAQPDVASISEDAPLPFDPTELADHLDLLATTPDFGQSAQFIATLTMRIKMMLADRRLGPIVAPAQQPLFEEWLTEYVGADQAASGQIAILDLSLIPPDVLHIVIAVIARVVFEATQRYRKLHENELPTVLVLEEAHSFIQRRVGEDAPAFGAAQMCRETFERIAREGRKFGLGLVLSSQRPSELSPTVLAQCNTFLIHRIVNDRDQELVGALVPDNLGALLRELPSLPSRQAILLGWATPIPVLVEMNELPLEHRPGSSDPKFWSVWVGDEQRPIDWSSLAVDWVGENPA